MDVTTRRSDSHGLAPAPCSDPTRANAGRIEDHGVQPEPLRELCLPLRAQPRRAYNEHARVRFARKHLGDDEPRLNGLAETHLVCNEQAAAAPRRDGQGGLELERDDGQACANGSAQRVRGGSGMSER